MSPPTSAAPLSNRMTWLADVGFLAILAAVVRVWAAQDELWFDEIWSLAFVRVDPSPLVAFTQHHDNNHILVTLWMYLCGPDLHNWFWYRAPSILAGAATVLLAARFAARWGRIEAIVAAVLTASSFLLVVYSSEARGYALAGCFALVGAIALERACATRDWRAGALFVIATLLALLAHLSAIMYYAGAAAWSLVMLYRRRSSVREALAAFAGLHVVPCLAIALLYWFHVRGMTIGGGPHFPMGVVVGRAAALGLGTGATEGLGLIASILAAASLFVAALVGMARARDDAGVFFLVTVVLAPAVVLAVRESEVLYERYFYLSLQFLLVAAAFLAGRLWRMRRAGPWLVAAALAVFVVANAALTWNFVRIGRSHFYDAVLFMAEQTQQPEIHVATDDMFVNGLYLHYYARYLPPSQWMFLHDIAGDLPDAPEWLVVSDSKQPFSPAQELFNSQRTPPTRYVLVHGFPFPGLSGCNCAVYRRADLATRP